MRASLGALRELSSQPVRIFRVTGSETALTAASRIRAALSSSRINAEPACWPLVTFFTGQPMLMSMMAAPRSSFSFAASATSAGSRPASCTAMGYSSAQLVAIFMVLRLARIIAWLAIISETTRPVPHRLTRRRNGMSLTPDMGASTTGSSRQTVSIWIRIVLTFRGVVGCLFNRQIRFRYNEIAPRKAIAAEIRPPGDRGQAISTSVTNLTPG